MSFAWGQPLLSPPLNVTKVRHVRAWNLGLQTGRCALHARRRLANREAARRMRRRRATHMAAVEEEVERLSQENSLLLHRLSQLVASHQVVDAENQQLRAELLALRQSVVRPCELMTVSYLSPSMLLWCGKRSHIKRYSSCFSLPSDAAAAPGGVPAGWADGLSGCQSGPAGSKTRAGCRRCDGTANPGAR